MYFLAVIFPPLAVLCSGKPLAALLNFLLRCTIVGWIPAAIHAFAVIGDQRAERRHQESLEVMSEGRYRRRR